jgi:hypothetical protein
VYHDAAFKMDMLLPGLCYQAHAPGLLAKLARYFCTIALTHMLLLLLLRSCRQHDDA